MRHTIKPFYEREENNIDFFNRGDFAQNLTNLLSNTDDSLVLTINASWGEGKTTFIKLWEKKLIEDQRFIPIYYNAFENDFTSDTFISIAVTIQKTIEEIEGGQESDYEDYKKATVELGVELTKMVANSAVKVSTGGVLAADSLFDWISGQYKNRIENKEKKDYRGGKELIGSKYDAFFKKEKLINEYHSKLKKLLKEDGDKKIIFFVDELDRCRPSFAIEVLEKIKHLFSVERVNFVLAINRKQLVEIITNSYGVNEEDAFIYLQKFVHVETTLPALQELRRKDKDKLASFVGHLFHAFDIPQDLDHQEFLLQLILKFSNNKFTPRSVERILTLYVISLDSCDDNKKSRLSKYILLLCVLKVEYPKIYRIVRTSKIIKKQYNVGERVKISIGTPIIRLLKDEDYIPQDEIEMKTNTRLKIDILEEAAKVVDIYDIPQEEKGYDGKKPQRGSGFQQGAY